MQRGRLAAAGAAAGGHCLEGVRSGCARPAIGDSARPRCRRAPAVLKAGQLRGAACKQPVDGALLAGIQVKAHVADGRTGAA